MLSGAQEGVYYCVEDSDPWQQLTLKKDLILEVTNPWVEGAGVMEGDCGLLVRDSSLGENLTLVVEAKSLGSDKPETAKALSQALNRKSGKVHFCLDHTCELERDCAVHITNVIAWSAENFSRSYITAASQRQLKKWLETGEAEDKGDEAKVGAGVSGREKPPGSEKPETKDDQKRQDLRARLSAVRSRMSNGGLDVPPAGPAGRARKAADLSETLLVESSPERYSPSVLDASEQQRMMSLKKARKKEKELQMMKEPPKDRQKGPEVSSGVLVQAAQRVSKGGTSNTLQKQLALRAKTVTTVKEKDHAAERKKKKDKDPGMQLVKLLTSTLKPKRKKRRDGKSKKVKKEREGGDPSSPGEEDPEDSSDDGGSQEESPSTDKDQKLEAPLLRRSKKRPGSVLEMLVKHAKEKLDQTGKVAIDNGEDHPVTSGIKLASYFSICIRPQISGNMNQQRELHHLSNAMDLLRLGELDRLGDLLASRFMSIHQSLIDGNWASAKFMEMMPLEEMSAAGPAVVMDARKHAKMNFKLVNSDPSSSWKGSGRGKGKPLGSNNNPDWQGDQKGKGKKGGGRGKGKQKNWWNHNWHAETDQGTGKKKENAAEK